MKKIFKLLLVFEITFSTFILNVFSYDYVDPSNELGVEDLKNDIYTYTDEFYEYFNDVNPENYSLFSSNKFWWPIGSRETTEENGVLFAKGDPETVTISSPYGERNDPFSGKLTTHSGIDITGSGGYSINIIAAKNGTVIYPQDNSNTSCVSNSSLDSCGGGYGNYVIIQHSDGTYSLYAHMYADSITVKAGDTVAQGQVIGKMGSSGKSTGAHLHFEIRVGENTTAATVNPLDYISADDPRPLGGSTSGFSLISTSLSLAEFKTKMEDYGRRRNNQNFDNVFLQNAELIYNIAASNGVNPELIVVTACTESGFNYHSDNNYWGIGAPNGSSTEASYSSFEEGVKAYASVIRSYMSDKYAGSIITRNNEREAAGCDPAGHGGPDTLQGYQSIYSWVGDYRFNPGNTGLGGCYYFNYMYGDGYCNSHPSCSDYNNCPENSRTTVCEQNDYTAWQVNQKVNVRYDIFGL